MFSDAPPCRDDVTTSWTCPEWVLVNTFTNSGMIAPASVPQVMIVESCHQRSVFPAMFGMSRYETRYVSATDTTDVSHTRNVSGASKLNAFSCSYSFLARASLMKYDAPDATTIITRIMKIQTSSWTCTSGFST